MNRFLLLTALALTALLPHCRHRPPVRDTFDSEWGVSRQVYTAQLQCWEKRYAFSLVVLKAQELTLPGAPYEALLVMKGPRLIAHLARWGESLHLWFPREPRAFVGEASQPLSLSQMALRLSLENWLSVLERGEDGLENVLARPRPQGGWILEEGSWSLSWRLKSHASAFMSLEQLWPPMTVKAQVYRGTLPWDDWSCTR
jgi:hypothetical protein